MKRARLQLDFAATPRRPRWPGWALLAFSLAVTVALLERYRDTTLASDRLAAAAELVVVPERRSAAKRLDEKSAQAAVRQLALPWGRLIESLERTTSPDIAVLQIQPESQQRTVTITGEARNAEAMFLYLRSVAKAGGLGRIHLVNHQVVESDPQRPIRFVAHAWFGALQ